MNSLANEINNAASQASRIGNEISSYAQDTSHINDGVIGTINMIDKLTSDFSNDLELKNQIWQASLTGSQANSLNQIAQSNLGLTNQYLEQVDSNNQMARSLTASADQMNHTMDSYMELANSYADELNFGIADVYKSLASSAAALSGKVTYDDSLQSLLIDIQSIGHQLSQLRTNFYDDLATIKLNSSTMLSTYNQVVDRVDSLAQERELMQSAQSANSAAKSFSNSLAGVLSRVAAPIHEASSINAAVDNEQLTTKSLVATAMRNINMLIDSQQKLTHFASLAHDNMAASAASQAMSHQVVARSFQDSAQAAFEQTQSLVAVIHSLNSDNQNVDQITSLAVANINSFNVSISKAYTNRNYVATNQLASKVSTAGSIIDSGLNKMSSNASRIHYANQMVSANVDTIASGNSAISELRRETARLGQAVASANSAADISQLLQMAAELGDFSDGKTNFAEEYQNAHANFENEYQAGKAQARDDHIVSKELANKSRSYLEGYVEAFNNKLIIHPNDSYNRKTIFRYGQRKQASHKSRISFYDARLKRLGLYRRTVMLYYVRKIKWHGFKKLQWVDGDRFILVGNALY